MCAAVLDAGSRNVRRALPLSAQSGDEVKWIAIAHYLFYNVSFRCIAGMLFRSHRTIARWWKNFKQYRHPSKRRVSGGRKLGICEIEFIKECIILNPTIYLDELAAEVSSVFEIDVSLATMCCVVYFDLST